MIKAAMTYLPFPLTRSVLKNCNHAHVTHFNVVIRQSDSSIITLTETSFWYNQQAIIDYNSKFKYQKNSRR